MANINSEILEDSFQRSAQLSFLKDAAPKSGDAPATEGKRKAQEWLEALSRVLGEPQDMPWPWAK